MSNQESGSFRALRNRHLPLFDAKLRRHDRGWPHSRPDIDDDEPPRPHWKTVGIFHFRHVEEADS